MFLDLVCKHFADDPLFDLKKYIEDIHDDNCNSLTDISPDNILPGTILIASDFNSNICYRGRECTVDLKALYLYQNYLIVYEYSGYGDDCNVCDIEHNYGANLFKFYEQCVHVYKKNEFDEQAFLAGSVDTTFLIQFFKQMYPETGLARFIDHMANLYEKTNT